jgi:hypothetical protein
LINIDEQTQKAVEERLVTFGAAIYHKRELLPEALLEDVSFASKKNVKDALKDIADIKGNLPREVEKVLDDFEKICQMRHCCVHRFGKLGAKNAIKLGLTAHSAILEKPLKLSKTALEEVAANLRNLVKVMNNYIFYTVLDRTVPSGRSSVYLAEWAWDYRRDRQRFTQYYSLFKTEIDAMPSPPAREVYNSFRQRQNGRS